MAVRIGVCSWSLRPSGPRELTERLRAAGLHAVQLALDPIRTGAWDEAETVAALADAGIQIASGMMAMRGEDYATLESIRRTGGVRPDEHWPANRDAAGANADLAARLGLRLVTFHAGFIPHQRSDPERGTIIARLRELADVFASRGVRVGLETGQESASTLLDALGELAHPNVGVNFDPANMILYGMGDPVEAVRALGPHLVQVHIKDAIPSGRPGEWGTEVRVGTGAVDWPAFFDALRRLPRPVDLMIEREAGADRLDDIAAARRLVGSMLDTMGAAWQAVPRGGS